MATKYLRKIILEELQKVLKEYTGEGEEFGSGGLTGQSRNIPTSDTRKEVEKYFDQQVSVSDQSIKVSGSGLKCKNAEDIQYHLRNKFSRDENSAKITSRISDNKIGPTTTQLLNIATGSKYPLNMSSYRRICKLNPDQMDIVIRQIKNLSKDSPSYQAVVKTAIGPTKPTPPVAKPTPSVKSTRATEPETNLSNLKRVRGEIQPTFEESGLSRQEYDQCLALGTVRQCMQSKGIKPYQ